MTPEDTARLAAAVDRLRAADEKVKVAHTELTAAKDAVKSAEVSLREAYCEWEREEGFVRDILNAGHAAPHIWSARLSRLN
jgi:multidrug resistance efflux pump